MRRAIVIIFHYTESNNANRHYTWHRVLRTGRFKMLSGKILKRLTSKYFTRVAVKYTALEKHNTTCKKYLYSKLSLWEKAW